MAVDVMFTGAPDGDDGPFFLSNGKGWSDTTKWVESLPNNYPYLQALVRDGKTRGSCWLVDDLRTALVASPPNEEVRAVVNGLLDNLMTGDPEESVTVLRE